MSKPKLPVVPENKIVDLAKEVTREPQTFNGSAFDDPRLVAIKNAARILINQLIAVESDPDYNCVFAVSKLHGYAYRGRFWFNESQQLLRLLEEYDKPQEKKG